MGEIGKTVSKPGWEYKHKRLASSEGMDRIRTLVTKTGKLVRVGWKNGQSKAISVLTKK